ncbi:hypothetical protein ACLEEB_12280 [Lonsdalea quercina]|uniref:hypothetical protein n=1 Tax=Lonsdalea quercina TaxID=71657 RepID=UPI003975A113
MHDEAVGIYLKERDKTPAGDDNNEPVSSIVHRKIGEYAQFCFVFFIGRKWAIKENNAGGDNPDSVLRIELLYQINATSRKQEYTAQNQGPFAGITTRYFRETAVPH